MLHNVQGIASADESKVKEYITIKRQFDDARFLTVVLVHGLNGCARRTIDNLMPHIDRHLKVNTVLVFPTYETPYQFLAPGLDRELLAEVDAARPKSRFHRKLCIYGFSAGAQFAHRFTYAHPDRVACCAALAAGSWTQPDGTYLDHPGSPGRLRQKPYNTREVHRNATRPARPGIDEVRWITGCGRRDIRYAQTRQFYASLEAAVPDATFISFNAGHKPTDHALKRVFQTFQSFVV